ncbi:MAG: hypothetical protein KKE93_04715 [Nanoarchaeota archaeon]|nr:hypothetical protein [Nanoarchaeota archaeon]
MADENETYVASVRSAMNQNVDPLTKEVTEKLIEEPNLTIGGIIDYLIKDDGFNDEEKEVMKGVKKELDDSMAAPERLSIKVLNEGGDGYKSFTNQRGEMTQVIKKTDIAKDYFEPGTIEETPYNGLNLEVHFMRKAGSRLDYILSK